MKAANLNSEDMLKTMMVEAVKQQKQIRSTVRDPTAFVEQFPRTQTVEIDGAGHWVHADQPAGFLAALGLVPAIAARAHAPTPADVQRSVLMFPWRRPA